MTPISPPGAIKKYKADMRGSGGMKIIIVWSLFLLFLIVLAAGCVSQQPLTVASWQTDDQACADHTIRSE